MEYSNIISKLQDQRDLFYDMSADFLQAANDQNKKVKEFEALRRRTTLRLVPRTKLAYEHLFLNREELD